MPNNETIERIAEKYTDVYNTNYPNRGLTTVMLAALSEMRQIALKEAREIAKAERVENETPEDQAYNSACDHIAAAILGRIGGL